MSSTSQAAASSGSQLTPSSGDSKATANICPWESQEPPQKQQEKSRSVDADVCPWDQSSEESKKTPETVLSTVPESSGSKSPSAATATPIIKEITEESSQHKDSETTKELQGSGRDAQAACPSSGKASAKQQVYRLSTDISNVQLNVDQASESKKSSHRELSASASVPCTSILGQTNLDFSVRSGHATGQYSIQSQSGSAETQMQLPISKSEPQVKPIDSANAQADETLSQSCGHQGLSDSAPFPISGLSAPQVRKIQTPRTVSVSSQTQTDPIVHHKTNQQTQYPSRDSSFRQSSRHSHKQTKQALVQYAIDYPPTSRSQIQQLQLQEAMSRSQQFHLQLSAFCRDNANERQEKQKQAKQESSVQRKHSEPLQKYNQQHRQQQYYLNKEELEEYERLQMRHLQSSAAEQSEEGRRTDTSGENQRQGEPNAEQRRMEQQRQRDIDKSLVDEQRRQKERHDQLQQQHHHHHHHLVRQHEIQQHLEQGPPQMYMPSPQQERQISLQHYGDLSHDDQMIYKEQDTSKRTIKHDQGQLMLYDPNRQRELMQISSSVPPKVENQEPSIAAQKMSHVVQATSTHTHPQMSSSQHHHLQSCSSSQPLSLPVQSPSTSLMPYDASRDVSLPKGFVSSSQETSKDHGRQGLDSQGGQIQSSSLGELRSQTEGSASGQIQIETSAGRIQITTSVSQKTSSASAEDTSYLPSSPRPSRPATKVWDDPADICPWEDE